MSHTTFDLVSQLLTAARYAEAADLVRVMQIDLLAAGRTADAELLETARELLVVCRERQSGVEAHWRAAGCEAVEESRARMRLSALLERLGAPPPVAPPVAAGRPDGATIAVRCLGTLVLRIGQRELGPVPNRRARSVLKYLLLHRERPVPKEMLMERFWPDAAAAAARNSLNVAVYGLRRFLQGSTGRSGHVIFNEDCYALDLDLVGHVDVDEFTGRVAEARRLARAGDLAGEVRELEAATDLYTGPLFDDDPYEDWVLPWRRELHDAFVGAGETLLDRYSEVDDTERRVRTARRILAAEPAHETAHRELMRSFARGGRRHLALRQYHDCEEAMDAELDIAPGPDTTRLYHRIRDFEPV